MASEVTAIRRGYALFARVLEYPDGQYREAVSALAGWLASASPEAAQAFAPFVATVAASGAAELEERHFRTFDLSPQCTPYVSVHLFGEESFKRAELMTGLAEAYAREGLARGDELPDHLATILRLGPSLPEWRELVAACLLRAIAAMQLEADAARNAYRPVLDALFVVLASELGLDAAKAARLVERQRAEGNRGRRDDGRIAPGPVVDGDGRAGGGESRAACAPNPFAEEGARG